MFLKTKKFNGLFDHFESSKFILILIHFIAGMLFFVLNYHTPFYGDDLDFRYIWNTKEMVTTFKEAAASSWIVYHERYGRMIPAFLICVLQFVPKVLFNIFNTVSFLALAHLVHKHAFRKRQSNSFLLMIYLSFWFCLQSFGGTVLWMSASIEYMWPTTFILLFLLPYSDSLFPSSKDKKCKNKPISLIFTFLFCVFGTIVCSFNEISAISACIFILLILVFKIYDRNTHRLFYEKCSMREVMGFIGAIAGCAFVTFAPGNFNRLSTAETIKPDQANIVLELAYRIVRATYYMCASMLPLFMLLSVFFLMCRFSDSNKTLSSKQLLQVHIATVYYLIITLASVYVFVFSKGFSTRFMIVPVAALLIAIGIMYSQVPLNTLRRSVITVLLIFIMAFAALQYATGLFLMRDSDKVLHIQTTYTRTINEGEAPLFHSRQ